MSDERIRITKRHLKLLKAAELGGMHKGSFKTLTELAAYDLIETSTETGWRYRIHLTTTGQDCLTEHHRLKTVPYWYHLPEESAP